MESYPAQEGVIERMLPHRSDKKKNPTLRKYRTLTKQEVLQLKRGDWLYYWGDGKAANVRVNGKVRTWKRKPDYVEIPMVYGLRDCFTITMYEALTFLMREVG